MCMKKFDTEKNTFRQNVRVLNIAILQRLSLIKIVDNA